MEHRQQHDKAVVIQRRQHHAAALDIVQQIAVRQHRALGPPGRAGRVDDHRQVRGVDARRRERAAHARAGAAAGAKLFDQHHAQPRTQHLQFRRRFGHRRVSHQHAHARVVEDEINLVRLEKIIDWHHRAARAQHPEQRRDKLRAILQPQADPVPALHAQLPGQARRQPVRLPQQRAIRKLVLAPENGGLVRGFFRNRAKSSSKVHGRGI